MTTVVFSKWVHPDPCYVLPKILWICGLHGRILYQTIVVLNNSFIKLGSVVWEIGPSSLQCKDVKRGRFLKFPPMKQLTSSYLTFSQLFQGQKMTDKKKLKIMVFCLDLTIENDEKQHYFLLDFYDFVKLASYHLWMNRNFLLFSD